MFQPPRCPHADCPRHDDPTSDFCAPFGSYQPRCRPRPVPRFRCRTCRRTFSRQTFRADYRDKKPHLNAPVVELLCSGVGLRQTGRLVGLSPGCVELKFRKLARHAAALDRNLRGELAPDEPLAIQLDEFETFEGRRNTRPLSIATCIERRSRFHIAARAAPIRPRGKMTPRRAAAIAAEQQVRGERPDRSQAATRAALAAAARLAPRARRVSLETDLKSTYGPLARGVFGEARLEHSQTASVLPRDVKNPLFPINHTEACMRDLNGRLRRESWLVSKTRWFLNLQLGLYCAYRNWVRPRFNRDGRTPGQLLGFVDRRLRVGELVGWRQDWGQRSPDPCGDGATTVAAFKERLAAA